MTQIIVKGLSNQQGQIVVQVVQAALEAADPRAAVRRALVLKGDQLQVASQKLDLSGFARIRVVGAGKAAPAMTHGLLDVLGPRIKDGLLITKHVNSGPGPLPERIRVQPGGHPVPTPESVASTQALEDYLSARLPQDEKADDLLFCLISGGGSALMTLPVEGVSLPDMQALTRLLLACGADIGEINTLRKHLDRVKGGGLARMAAPARVITLILSDVIGSPLDVIASGPTVADSTTYGDALGVLHKYEIADRVPKTIRDVLERGVRGEQPESVKQGDAVLARVTNLIVASNLQAAEAAQAKAQQLGLQTRLLTTSLQGEASEAGIRLAGLLKQVAEQGQPLPRPACLIAGGETTVTLNGDGLGGRNQEMALAAAIRLSGTEDVACVTFGTDGEDGPTDAAGAVSTGQTVSRASAKQLDPHQFLKNNDSYHFFAALGDLLITGPTGTNVNDLVFLFAF